MARDLCLIIQTKQVHVVVESLLASSIVFLEGKKVFLRPLLKKDIRVTQLWGRMDQGKVL